MRWLATFLAVGLAGAAGAQEASPLATPKDRLSYAMGMDLGQQLKTQAVEIDPAVFGRGLADALSGGATLLTAEEARGVIAELQKAMIVKRAEEARLAGAKNKAEGDAFLAANAAKEGVVTLPSGLQYRVVTSGTGRKPTLEDTAVCQYRLRLVDGREVDSSYTRGQPFAIPVKGAIKGWTEALQLMPVGSKWEVFVPPSLGYGERGAGADIGPNATLVFEMELVDVR
jgi:FKBP-type peptidyl-prolyl cis-trans isomerase FklB